MTKTDNSKRGFSLIELLIVILIISVVYFLGFSGIEKPEKKVKALTALNLKSTLLHSSLAQKRATFLCVDKCKSCYIRGGINSPLEAYENKIDLKDTQVYTLDERESLFHLEYGRYRDKKICLVIDFYRNGSSTQLILENSHGIYFLPAFFGEPKKVDSLEEAKDLWLKNSNAVSNSGDFY